MRRLVPQVDRSKVSVVRNDAITISQIKKLSPNGIILSPGPGGPDQAGICLAAVGELSQNYPMLGVCLGHQVICQAFGATIVRAPKAIHGKQSWVTHTGAAIFSRLPSPLAVGRYHSLMVEPSSIPTELEIIAQSQDGVIMAVAHLNFRLWGVQFHPESFLTESGDQIITNFLQACLV